MFPIKVFLFALLCSALPQQLFAGPGFSKPLSAQHIKPVELEMLESCYGDPAKKCEMCTTSLAEEKSTRLSCKHVFHERCIGPVLRSPASSYKCPVDRCRVQAVPMLTLVEAAAADDSLAITLLLKAGIAVDKRDRLDPSQQTALMKAALCGHIDIVRQLLRVRANPVAADQAGKAVLAYAVEGGCRVGATNWRAIINQLYGAGACFYEWEKVALSPLQVAFAHENTEIARCLLVSYLWQCEAWSAGPIRSGYFMMDKDCKPFYDEWNYAQHHASPAMLALIRPVWNEFHSKEVIPLPQ